MQAWEYTVRTFDIQPEAEGEHDGNAERDSLIAELGAAGWELVTVVPLTLAASTRTAGTTHERWVFKRSITSSGAYPAVAQATAEREHSATGDPGDTPPLTGMKEIPNPQRKDQDP
jgi:hypothetical protein